MYQLRIQTNRAARTASIEGALIATYGDCKAALDAITANQADLDFQLVANAEGSTALTLNQVIVKIDGNKEAGCFWSSYRPAT